MEATRQSCTSLSERNGICNFFSTAPSSGRQLLVEVDPHTAKLGDGKTRRNERWAILLFFVVDDLLAAAQLSRSIDNVPFHNSTLDDYIEICGIGCDTRSCEIS